eukprot:4784230-Amphidinium_carterae.1
MPPSSGSKLGWLILCSNGVLSMAAYFPVAADVPGSSWQPPKMQPWEECVHCIGSMPLSCCILLQLPLLCKCPTGSLSLSHEGPSTTFAPRCIVDPLP